MRKKLLAIFITLSICCLSMTSFAATITNIEANIDGGANGITVSGTTDDTKGNRMLMLRFLNAEGAEVFVTTTDTVYTADGATFDFDMVLMPDDLESGTYEIVITGNNFDAHPTETIEYSNPSDILGYIKAIEAKHSAVTAAKEAEYESVAEKNNAINQKLIDLFNCFYSYTSKLGVTVADINDINADDDGKLAFANILYNDMDYGTFPADDASNADKIAYNNSIIESLKDVTYDAEAIALYIIADTSDVSGWMTRYYYSLGFADGDYVLDDNDEPTDEIKDRSLTYYFETVKDKDDFKKRIVAAEGKPTVEEVEEELHTAVLLSMLCYGSDTDVEDVFLTYADYFIGDNDETVDVDGYGDLNASEKAYVIGKIDDTSYPNIDDARKAFNDAVANPVTEGGESDSTPSRNNGVFGGGSTITLPAASENAETNVIFTDLDSVAWAKDAIENLYSLKVVNGYPDGTFAPNNVVTRAEFIKMVSTAMGVSDVVAKSNFADVNENDWFYPYVASAELAGLVTGDENACFNPNAPITREDMTVILYRVLGLTDGGEPGFADAGQISDYAKNAVAYFAAKGIVNGVGDGNFAPKNNATRAETAVIIYRIINK